MCIPSGILWAMRAQETPLLPPHLTVREIEQWWLTEAENCLRMADDLILEIEYTHPFEVPYPARLGYLRGLESRRRAQELLEAGMSGSGWSEARTSTAELRMAYESLFPEKNL